MLFSYHFTSPTPSKITLKKIFFKFLVIKSQKIVEYSMRGFNRIPRHARKIFFLSGVFKSKKVSNKGMRGAIKIHLKIKNQGGSKQMYKEMKLVLISEIETQEVDWLSYPYIPFGNITIIQGDLGEGKKSCER